MQEAQERLWELLSYEGLQRCPVLVCANKQDLPTAMCVMIRRPRVA